MISKELSNDQRARLEQIARDEFAIKQREVSSAKQKVFNDWIKEQCVKMEKSPLALKYAKLHRELNAVRRTINDKGFSIDVYDNKGAIKVSMYTSSYSGNTTSNSIYQTKWKASLVNNDSFTRGLNKVLAIIWSMEKPFSECIKLIESEVKKIK